MINGSSIDELAVELLGKTADSLSIAERRVLESIHRREITSRDLGVPHGDEATFGQRLADHVAAIGGSWGFIIGFAVVLFGWMLLNSRFLESLGITFDPYPFIFLNLMLSTLAAIQAPIIMMSQNRQAEKDRQAAAHDYEVNLRAELEIIRLHEKMNDLQQDLNKLLKRQEGGGDALSTGFAMTGYHIAQINIARFVKPKDHPDNAGFMDALDHVNAQADGAPGFIWRLVGDGNDAISIDAIPDDPRLAVNMSVWTDIEALAAFVYRNPDHLAIMRRRREWLEQMDLYQVLWWVPVGHVPTVDEGMARLQLLKAKGPTADAFTFRQNFAAPDGTPARPILDECA